ncbi:MAG: carbohydrate kinase family protein [Bacteroidales bacterium]
MHKIYDLLVVGELNVDVILNQIDGYPQLGKEIFAQRMDVVLGSSSAIFASVAATLGLKVAFAGMVGHDAYGHFILNQLANRGINTVGVKVSQDYASGATLVLNYGNERAMVTYPGAMAHFKLVDIDGTLLQQSRHLHVSSVFLQPGMKADWVQLMQKAHEAGLTTSMDPQWDPAEAWDLPWEELLPRVDYFLPNAAELKAITGREDLKEAMDALLTHARTLIVKDGTQGAWLGRGNERVHQPAFINHQVVDAIGAGDSFDAGFITGMLKGLSETESLRLASLCGAINTTAAGGTGAFVSLPVVRQMALNKFGTKFLL